MLERVIGTIQAHRMFASGDTVIVAVSGGADSTALLHLLAGLRARWDLTLHAAHLDHGLRATSAEDAAFVQASTGALDVPVTVQRRDVRALATQQRRSIEDAGRATRYAFLAEVAARVGARAVATGHTRDDQVETVGMRLLQGAPWDLLAGIPPSRPLATTTVVRPLREVTRAEVVAFLIRAGASWRDDPTNRDLRMLRNRIRHRLLPEVVRAYPGAAQALLDLGEAAARSDALLRRLAGVALGHHLVRSDGARRLPRAAFRGLPAALQARVLSAVVAEVAGTARPLPRVVLDRLVRVAVGGRVGSEVPAGGAVVRVGYDDLEIVPPEPAPHPVEYALPVPGMVRAEPYGLIITAEVIAGDGRAPVPPDREAHFDAACVRMPLRVRAWRPGDRFTPRGLGGKKKVQDLFVDAKVPRWQRSRVALVTDAADQILWVVGYRIADLCRPIARTARVLRLRAQRLDLGRESPYGMVD